MIVVAGISETQPSISSFEKIRKIQDNTFKMQIYQKLENSIEKGKKTKNMDLKGIKPDHDSEKYKFEKEFANEKKHGSKVKKNIVKDVKKLKTHKTCCLEK